jgi:hypothetical protein
MALYFCDRYQNQCTMGCFFFFDCLVGLIILICIHAPWWAWTLYAVSAVVGFFVWAAQDSDSGDKKNGGTKQE